MEVWYAADSGGTYISEDDLSIQGVAYRKNEGVPYLFWRGKNNCKIQQIGKNPILPRCFVKQEVEKLKLCSIHTAYGHFSKKRILEAVKAGTVVLSADELGELKRHQDYGGVF
ncbi:unnamed protein product [Ambrosiozyma monospora]|uniref:Unnamed protein product n=1 Tax=Ambrosiozyma monospora TaxID=43982 RepID=A0ACB5UCB6_AMBMO|nr:unnamed protein product [Ambrosiozyma monospora]